MANSINLALVVDYHETRLLEQLNQDHFTRPTDSENILTSVPTNPLAFDRYAYALNNPIRYNDPTGHCPYCVPIGITLGAVTPVGWAIIGITVISVGAYYAIPGVRETVTNGMVQAFEAASDGLTAAFAKKQKNQNNHGKLLQSGGHTISEKVRKTLGLTKDQLKAATEALKDWAGKGNDFHGKIWEDGTITDPNTGKKIGNIKDFLP